MICLRYLFPLSILFLFSCKDSRPSASATIQVHPATIMLNHNHGNLPSLVTISYIEETFERILSETTLSAAATEAGVDIETIRTSLKLSRLPDTDFIKITAHHTDRATAVRIANTMADVFIETEKVRETERAKRALTTLDDELQKQNDIVQDRRKSLTVLIQEYGIHHGGPPTGLTEEGLYRWAQENLEKLENDSTHLKSQIEKFQTASKNDLMRTITSLGLFDATSQVTFHFTQYRNMKDSISTLQAQGLGPNHPEIQAFTTKASNALANLKKEVLSLKEVLKTRLRLVNRQIKRMREMVVAKNSMTLSMAQHYYSQAQTDYEAARDLLSQMKIKQQEARVLLNTPRIPVTLHERAK